MATDVMRFHMGMATATVDVRVAIERTAEGAVW